MNLSPKKEYSCQQTYVPGDETPTPLLKMRGQGQCQTNPYDFQSFITSAGNDPWAAGVCGISIYPKAHCMGQPKIFALTLHGDGCTFGTGRSARLDCSQSSDMSSKAPLSNPDLTLLTTYSRTPLCSTNVSQRNFLCGELELSAECHSYRSEPLSYQRVSRTELDLRSWADIPQHNSRYR